MEGDARSLGARIRGWAWIAVPVVIGAVALGRWIVAREQEAPERGGPEVVPVEVAPAVIGSLEAARELTGTLEPSAEVVVAAEIVGTVEAVHADLSDEVAPDQILAAIDDREYRQAEAAARAELAVARARAEAAEGTSRVAARALERTETLAERGIASERALDAARGTAQETAAALTVARAEVARSRAAWNAARLDLERTEIRGRWQAGAGPRRVATRHVDEGARVSAGDPLFTLIDTDPLVIAVMVGAEDYARLAPGQRVALRGPAGEAIEGEVARVAPSFDPQSRQARIEIEVANPDARLQAGTFVRARTVLAQVDEATLVPEVALVTRDGDDVVFVFDEATDTVRMVAVDPGLRADGRVELRGAELSGSVVTLGQQRLTDGARVRVTERGAAETER